eukprot:TRINITY_DN13255_c0_g1_i1.p1 TRINITY_DN13255_c0_g1~~TRINITY_DN13255_c0_g1_i1.p1  ORF type:complete len:628 (+),score=138.06 TRINITY_DN13255_c0_g1_i1:79-1962(+)
MIRRPRKERGEPSAAPAKDPNPLHRIPKFQLHALYQRTPISHRYGGGIMNGIVVPKNQPYIFLFSSTSPTEDNDNPYEDGRRGHEYHYSGEGLDGDQKLARGNKNLFEHRELKRHVFLFHRVKDGSFKGSGGQPYRYEGEYMVRQKYVIDSTGQDDKKRLAMRFILTPHDSIANPLWDDEYEWEPARVPVYATGGQAVPTAMSGPDSKLKPLYARNPKFSSPIIDSDAVEPGLIGPPAYLQRHRELAPLDGFRVAISDVKDLGKLFSHLCFAPGPWNNQKVAPVDINTLIDKPFVPEPYPEKVESVRQAVVAEMQRWHKEDSQQVAPLTSKLKKYNIQQRTTRRLQSKLRQARQVSGKSAPRRRAVDEMELDDSASDNLEEDDTGAIQIDDSVDGRRRRRRPVDHGDVMVPIDSDEESSSSSSAGRGKGKKKKEKKKIDRDSESEDESEEKDDEEDGSFKSRKSSKKVGRPSKEPSGGSAKKRGRAPKRKREDDDAVETPRAAAVVAVASLSSDGEVEVDDDENKVNDESSEEKEEDKMDVSDSEDSVRSAEESKSVSQHIASHQEIARAPRLPPPRTKQSSSSAFLAKSTHSSSQQQSSKNVHQAKLTDMFSSSKSKPPVNLEDSE